MKNVTIANLLEKKFSILVFDLLVQGSESCLRSGFHFALTTTDHPAAELSSASNRVPFGFVTSIGLEKKEVQFHLMDVVETKF